MLGGPLHLESGPSDSTFSEINILSAGEHLATLGLADGGLRAADDRYMHFSGIALNFDDYFIFDSIPLLLRVEPDEEFNTVLSGDFPVLALDGEVGGPFGESDAELAGQFKLVVED